MTLSYPVVRLVTAPEVGATVLFDFNGLLGNGGGSSGVQTPAFSIGVPSIDGDPDAIGVQYGFRTLTYTILVKGTRAQALTVLAKAAPHLLRERPGFLLFQLDADTEPVWFDLLRPTPGDLSFERVFVNPGHRLPDTWEVTLELPAQPFALGARVTIGPVTIQNDPAVGGCQTVLPAIKGDAPAPLRITANPPSDIFKNGERAQWIVSPLEPGQPTASIVKQIGTGDIVSAGPDTGGAVSDAAYSGGSYRAVTFTTNPAVVTRVSGNFVDLHAGDYMVFVRAARASTNGRFWLQFGHHITYPGFGPLAAFDRVASISSGHAQWVYCGVVRYPYASPDVPPGIAFTNVDAPDFMLAAGRMDGTGDLHLDAIKLVPYRLLGAEHPASTIQTSLYQVRSDLSNVVWDGDTETVIPYSFTGTDMSVLVANSRGGFPVVVPGKQNVLTYFRSVDTQAGYLNGNNSVFVTGSVSVTVSYHPQLLWIDGT